VEHAFDRPDDFHRILEPLARHEDVDSEGAGSVLLADPLAGDRRDAIEAAALADREEHAVEPALLRHPVRGFSPDRTMSARIT
jgi:hypothetical protein